MNFQHELDMMTRPPDKLDQLLPAAAEMGFVSLSLSSDSWVLVGY